MKLFPDLCSWRRIMKSPAAWSAVHKSLDIIQFVCLFEKHTLSTHHAKEFNSEARARAHTHTRARTHICTCVRTITKHARGQLTWIWNAPVSQVTVKARKTCRKLRTEELMSTVSPGLPQYQQWNAWLRAWLHSRYLQKIRVYSEIFAYPQLSNSLPSWTQVAV